MRDPAPSVTFSDFQIRLAIGSVAKVQNVPDINESAEMTRDVR